MGGSGRNIKNANRFRKRIETRPHGRLSRDEMSPRDIFGSHVSAGAATKRRYDEMYLNLLCLNRRVPRGRTCAAELAMKGLQALYLRRARRAI